MSHDGYEALLGELQSAEPAGNRLVRSQDNTQREAPAPGVYDGVDQLFGQSAAYQFYKKEMPMHRLILWATINRHKPKEIAALCRCSVQTVYEVRKQPWFQEAFCKITSEQGKDAFKTLLEGEMLPTLQRTINLAINAKEDSVKLAANKELLDRYLGKSVAKTEVKQTGHIDHLVYDAEQLMEEDRRLSEQLKARGLMGAN